MSLGGRPSQRPEGVHHRVRFGVAKFPDGWNAVMEIDGRRQVYDPTVATEREAEDLARKLRQSWDDVAAEHPGVEIVSNRERLARSNRGLN